MTRSVFGILISALMLTVHAPPAAAQKKVSVKSVKPLKGAPGTEITISGENFAPEMGDNRVFLSKIQLKITNVFPNTITAIIPAKAKTGTITVQTRKNGTASAPKPFTVLPPLVIKGISSKVVTPGSQLVVRGSGFDKTPNKNKISIGGKNCKVVRVSANELVFDIPQRAKTGTLKIEVPGRPPVESPGDITVVEQPKITKVIPRSGRPGDEVTIKGTKFGTTAKDVEVRFGAVPVQVLSVSDSEIKIRLTPEARSGAVQLAVNGIKSDPSKQSFDVKMPLTATRMEPLSVSPGGDVRIFGSGFSTQTKDHVLMIDDVAVKAHESTPTYVAFQIPKKISGGKHSVRLEVKKIGTVNIPVPLTVVQQIEVSGFSPESGPGGSTVTIYGSNFGNVPGDVRVYIGRQFAKVRSVSPEAIVVTLPQNAASSRFTVQTRYNGTAVSANNFSVGVPLSVSSFSPSTGRPNQQVRIYGQGFSANPSQNQVALGKVSVPVLQAAPNNLLVQIPPDAQSDRFSVTVAGHGTAQTPGTFQVIQMPKAPAAAAISITNITPESGTVGSYVRVTGTGFANGMRAYVGRTPAGVRVYSATQAMIGVPSNATGGAITFMLPSGARATSKQTFVLAAEVTVNKFFPISGRPGARVTIYGSEFVPGKTAVYLGKLQLPVQPGGNATMLQVTIPDAAESGPFRVLVPGKKEIRSVGAFKVLPPLATFKPTETPKPEEVLASKPDDTPVIEKLMEEEPKEAIPVQKGTPEKAPTMDELLGFESDGEVLEFKSFDPEAGAVGDTVMLNGSGFGDDPKKVQAWFGEKKANVVGCVPDMIMVEVPKGAGKGRIKLRIGGKPPLTSKKDFDVTK